MELLRVLLKILTFGLAVYFQIKMWKEIYKESRRVK